MTNFPYSLKSTLRGMMLFAVLLFSACTHGAVEPRHLPDCVAPPFLVPGDKIALLSPSYSTPMENVDSAAAILRGWGFEPVIGPHVGNTYLGSYAGTPAERVEDLRWALRDSSIKAILCNRGGYGTIHLMDMLKKEDFAASPKWMVGYSDITTLHEMETFSGVMSIYGPMGVSLVKTGGRDHSSTLMRDLLMGRVPMYTVDPHPENIPGTATGTLVGGNLCTFSPILGTWADVTSGKDFILFIEEVEENMSHIDRLINSLILNGVFERCKGVILGEFTDCGGDGLDYDSVEQMICSYLKEYNIPVCCDFPCGHSQVNVPLVMGAKVRLTVSEEGSEIRFLMDGTQVPVHAFDTDTLLTETPVIDRIRQRGTVLVGTTGDYRPLSFKDPETGAYWGFDLDVAGEIAKEMNVSVTYVPTSWPTLTADVQNPALFDFAIGGITVTDTRLETMDMSEGYLENGKTILCRKEDAGKFTCLEDLNRPEVRVMVNPGGLNEKFAREELPNCTLIVFEKNEEIPDQIAGGMADVMITEITEAPWYVQNDSRLAAPLLDNPFTSGQIGALMRKGQKDLLDAINTTIRDMKADGRLKALHEKYGLTY